MEQLENLLKRILNMQGHITIINNSPGARVELKDDSRRFNPIFQEQQDRIEDNTMGRYLGYGG